MASEFVGSIIAGIISGLIASGLFFYFISTLRPKLTISKEICRSEDKDGVFYGFKILNNSNFHVLDLRIEIILMSPFNSNGGVNNSMTWINLRKDHILLFPRFRKKDDRADYALIVATRDNLENIWNQEAEYLVIKVHGRQSFSGMSRSFEQKYYTKKSCIKPGIFNFGKTFDIS